MKKLLIIIFLFLGLICRVSATEKSIDTLSKIENSILGIDYSNQKTEKRLDRIEEYVYGHKNTGNNNTRLQKLAKDLNADVIGQEIEPCENTMQTEPEEIADNSVDYPILDDVEKKLSLKSNKNQTLHSRLVAIEQNMFKKVFYNSKFAKIFLPTGYSTITLGCFIFTKYSKHFIEQNPKIINHENIHVEQWLEHTALVYLLFIFYQ